MGEEVDGGQGTGEETATKEGMRDIQNKNSFPWSSLTATLREEE